MPINWCVLSAATPQRACRFQTRPTPHLPSAMESRGGEDWKKAGCLSSDNNHGSLLNLSIAVSHTRHSPHFTIWRFSFSWHNPLTNKDASYQLRTMPNSKPRTSRFAPPPREHDDSDDEPMYDEEEIDLEQDDDDEEENQSSPPPASNDRKKDKRTSRRQRPGEGETLFVEEEEDDGEQTAKIPEDLLTRILHEFFAREDTRISKAANRALGKYFEVFVGEAIARTGEERPEGSFLEVRLFFLALLDGMVNVGS
jgi:centromere protein X